MAEDIVKEIFADIKQEGSDPFEDIEKAIQSESQPEKEAKEEVKKEEPKKGENTPEIENIPFHKHPRWIEKENELKELRKFKDEISPKLSEIESRLKTDEKVEIPDWFKELYGENETAYRKYLEHEDKRTQEIEQNLISRQEQTRVQAEVENQKWDKWVIDQISTLKSEGKEFDEAKLKKVMIDYSPTDASNNLDFQKGYKIYEALEKNPINSEKSQARKQLGDITTQSPKGEAPKKDFLTAHDLRNRSWGSLGTTEK